MTNLVQNLEPRRLLSSTLTDGVLVVEGTAKNNVITISLNKDGSKLTVKEALKRRGNKTTAGTKSTFDAAAVSSIVVNGNAGNDLIVLSAKREKSFTTPVTINGGSGNDLMRSLGGTDLLNGDDGDDKISAGAGADIVNGGAGDDWISGDAGADFLVGGDGDDRLIGGKGVDTLKGGDGDDTFLTKGDKAADVVDGGTDSAEDGEKDQDFVIGDKRNNLTDIVTNATIRGRDQSSDRGNDDDHDDD
ncbi:MAG TPA: hypothetical protein PK402_00920 [Tepidisphaeraceae bacterium]|nr:hypothetical protein [Tepidisphaeraceae bacterium]